MQMIAINSISISAAMQMIAILDAFRERMRMTVVLTINNALLYYTLI
jgi:hypothetical protein